MWWVFFVVISWFQCLLYSYLNTHQYYGWNSTWNHPRWKIHSIVVGFIIVVYMYRTVPDPHRNSPLIKSTMLPKNKYPSWFIIEHADKIMQLVKFVSTERSCGLGVEVTVDIFLSGESHDIFFPIIINPDLNRISMTSLNHRVLHKLVQISSHILRPQLYPQYDPK